MHCTQEREREKIWYWNLDGTKSLRNAEYTAFSLQHTALKFTSIFLTQRVFLIQLVMTLVLCVTRLGCPLSSLQLGTG